MKKENIFKMIIIAVCASFILTGCALSRMNNTSPSGETAAQTETAALSETAGEDQTDAAGTGEEENVSEGSGTAASGEGEQNDEETVTISLTGSGASAFSDKVSVSGSDIVISSAGTYIFTGTLDNGSVTVDADKEDSVHLILDGADINSDTYAAVYVKQADEVLITSREGSENTLSNAGTFTQRDENNVDAVIFSKDDLTLDGGGTLKITSPAGHGVAGSDDVTVDGGVYEITAEKCAVRANDSITVTGGALTLTAGTDGLHAENDEDDTLGNVSVTGGALTIKAADDAIHANTLLEITDGDIEVTGAEGLEATYVKIAGGDISVSASDDGVNAAYKSSAYTPAVEISGGKLTVVMSAGDTDAVDSNGNIVITGGTVDITGQSAFDYDGSAQFTGGTVIINGQQVDSLPNQMMGGGMMGGMPGGMGRRG